MVYIPLFIGIAVVGLIILYVYWQMTRLPKNRPEKFRKTTPKKVIVLAGDSVTHGQIGENYVTMLSKRFNQQQFEFVNAGVNSHLAWNLLQRIDEIIDCEPDFVTIMIGTNDANAATSKTKAESYVKRMKLPRMPDQSWYQENLQEIVSRLQEETSTNIALISIPSLGEDPDHFAHKLSSEYCESIKEVANLTGVTYLPFHEKMVEIQKDSPSKPTYPLEKTVMKMIAASFNRYVLRKNWDSIGNKAGFQLHIDYLHLNTRGAMLVTDLIEEFIRRSS